MGSSRSTPTSSTVQQVRQEYPAYFQPYLEDVLEGAQQQYQRSYEPFPESRLVETPEKRTEALTALQDMDLARMSQGVYSDAISGTQAAGTGFPDTNMEAYMNPYQQLVTDQLLRNATERRGVARKGIGDAAARAGAYGGSRQGVTEAMFDRDTQRELTDLDERSSMAAFQNALSASQADKQRQLASSAQLGQLGQAQQQALTSGIAGVEKAATAEQALAQQGRDVALQDFMSQEGFDKQKLAEYSSIIRGATPPANQFIDKTTSTPQSGLQQLGGLASIGAGLFGGMGKAKGGPVEYAHGGDITQDVVTDAIDKLADIGMGKITMPTPGMDALRAVIAPKPIPQEEEIEVTENIEDVDVMGIDGTTGLQGLGQAPVDDGFNPNNAVEVTTDEMSETMMGNTGGPVGLAYGGVPGQPYTEDIGMVGGLAAVAGPQMRFADGKSVPEKETETSILDGIINFIKEGSKKSAPRYVGGERSEFTDGGRTRMGGDGFGESGTEFQVEEGSVVDRLQKRPLYTDGGRKRVDFPFEIPPKKLEEYLKSTEPLSTSRSNKVSLDAVVDEMGYGDHPDDVVFEQMEMDISGPAAPKKEQPLKQPLPTKSTSSIDMEALRKLDRDPGISRSQMVAAGLAALTGRESGLTAASQAITGGKGTLSDLDVELKGLDASQKNEANKAKLAELLRKRAADRVKTSLQSKKYAMEVVKLQRAVKTGNRDAILKLWKELPLIGKNNLMRMTDPEAAKMLAANPNEYVKRLGSALASLETII